MSTLTNYLLRISNLSQLVCIDNNKSKLKLKENHKEVCKYLLHLNL